MPAPVHSRHRQIVEDRRGSRRLCVVRFHRGIPRRSRPTRQGFKQTLFPHAVRRQARRGCPERPPRCEIVTAILSQRDGRGRRERVCVRAGREALGRPTASVRPSTPSFRRVRPVDAMGRSCGRRRPPLPCRTGSCCSRGARSPGITDGPPSARSRRRPGRASAGRYATIEHKLRAALPELIWGRERETLRPNRTCTAVADHHAVEMAAQRHEIWAILSGDGISRPGRAER
jgi:hypothetical protein